MPSRRDQLQSYQFLVHRTISAFVMRETDPAVSPLRRGVGAVFAGVMAAVLVATGFGVKGLLSKTGATDIREGTVVVERETGASYVFLGSRLHPALNYASALLAAGKSESAVSVVGAKTLAGVPRGVTVGIPGAPASLPAASRVVGMPWTLCSENKTLSLYVAAAPTARPVGDQGLLVSDPAGAQDFLLWHGRRYLVRSPQTVLPALFGALAGPAPVGSAWLNALPAGTDIAPLEVAGQGADSPALPGRRIGDLLVATTGAGPQYYLVRADGVEPINALQKQILLGQFSAQPLPVSLSDVAGMARSRTPGPGTGATDPPQNPPTLATLGSTDTLCAVTSDARSVPALTVGSPPANADAAVPTGPSGVGVGVVDRILVPSDRAAVVRALPSPDAVSGAYYLVTDIGIRYFVPTDGVLRMLGYDAATATDIPAALVAPIPAGPALDPAAAVQPVQLAAAGGS